MDESGDKLMTMRLLLLLPGMLLTSPLTWAVEPLSTTELVSHCDKYYDEQATEDRVFCVRYVQGFIDGAVATDEPFLRNHCLKPQFLQVL